MWNVLDDAVITMAQHKSSVKDFLFMIKYLIRYHGSRPKPTTFFVEFYMTTYIAFC